MRWWPILCLLAAPLGAEEMAFAKFGPLPRYAEPAGRPEGALPVEPGAAYPVAGREGGFVALDHPEGRAWVRLGDVFLTDRPQRVAAGPGYAVAERQRLRFWSSHARLAAFLSQGDARANAAEFEEIPDPGAPQGFLAYAVDHVDLRGRRPTTMAALLVPVGAAHHAGFERLRGTSGALVDIQLLVDVSADVRGFTEAGLPDLIAELRRRLGGSPNRITLTLGYFAAGLPMPGARPGSLTPDAPPRLGGMPATDATSRPRPALEALHAAAARVPEEAAAAAIVLWTGQDIGDEARVARAAAPVTLDAPALAVPPQLALLLAEAGPEPAGDLARLAEALPEGAARIVPFGPGQPAELARMIAETLTRRPVQPIADTRLSALCDGGGLCLVPVGASTATPLPPPPAVPEGAAAPEWYGVLLWTVVDGLILRLD